MLPRPRLLCQEPGLKPIGRSPGVPDKSSRGLGSMSRYSALILICFIAYIFLFYSSVGLVGNFAGLPTCTVPSATVLCNQNEVGHQTIKSPSMPCWGAAWKHSLAFIPLDWWNWQIKWMKYVSIGSFQYKSQMNGKFFCIPVSNFTVFQPRLQTDFGSLELGQLRLFWCHLAVKLHFESLFQEIRHENGKIWR